MAPVSWLLIDRHEGFKHFLCMGMRRKKLCFRHHKELLPAEASGRRVDPNEWDNSNVRFFY